MFGSKLTGANRREGDGKGAGLGRETGGGGYVLAIHHPFSSFFSFCFVLATVFVFIFPIILLVLFISGQRVV